MSKPKIALSLPGDNIYLREQESAAKAAANRLGVDLQVLNAQNDPILQSQQLLELVHAASPKRLDGILLEPVSATGLPRVAEAAVAAGIGWVVSNAQVDYIAGLRKKTKTPVFMVSQDHVEVGRIQARQMAAMLPQGGSVLYLRGPAANHLASKRTEGVESTKPANVDVKSLKIPWTADSAYKVVCSWLSLSTVRPQDTQLIFSQNADFILGAKKAFQTNTNEPERSKWLAVPCAGIGIPSQIRPLVDQKLLRAAVVTSVTLDTALEMLVKALNAGSQPPEQTFVDAHSYPSLEELSSKQG
ncbi:MAG TPA: sugar ABC transporter substrate-binding protein [Methylomirabilota bacterium]|nr:sugar ABC transporter substrate-binding protein [Methylomirabilota bacterium]